MLRRLMGQMKKNEGFTLIELLVVVAIIALLATFAVPKLFDAINKSKKAPGDADMNTLSSAMERYYFDNNQYPQGANESAVMNGLKNGYVKANTTFANGFNKGYVYFTNATGTFYVLVDPQNNAGAMTVTCGTDPVPANNWVSTSVTVDGTFKYSEQTTAPTGAQLNQGCRVNSSVTGFDVTKTSVVTN